MPLTLVATQGDDEVRVKVYLSEIRGLSDMYISRVFIAGKQDPKRDHYCLDRTEATQNAEDTVRRLKIAIGHCARIGMRSAKFPARQPRRQQ